MARIRNSAGALLTQASVSALSVVVTDTVAGTSATLTPVISATVFDALQQGDARWQIDSASNPGEDGSWGFNFAYVVPAANLPAATLYQCDAVFTTVSGEPFRAVFRFNTVAVYG